MQFYKYEALGNDYLVLDARIQPKLLSRKHIKLVCNRHRGLGSDGILYGPLDSKKADFGLKIFNPDGSEAEKSGNGLRIFARYLIDRQIVKKNTFTLETLGGICACEVLDNGRVIQVDMGKVHFILEKTPNIKILNKEYPFHAASIGNPHCVLPMEAVSEKVATKLGPLIEKHALFPKKTNVQFLQAIDRENIKIEIWERGAGYTLSSGSSASAAAAVAHKMGLCKKHVSVQMSGGALEVIIGKDYAISIKGPVKAIGICTLSPELFDN